jgi:hypothetical protein
MKKHIISFSIFCVVFFASLSLLFLRREPEPQLSYLDISAPQDWMGYVEIKSGNYSGQLLQNEFCGIGQLAFLTGETYEGSWNNSQMSGSGEINFPGIGTYNGEFQNSKREGTGTFTWEDGAVYTGNWVADQMSGSGTYTFSNGNSLTGTFSNNEFVKGEASFVWTNGDSYSGEILNGKFSGAGTYTFANGNTLSGKFKNNDFVSGEGNFKWENGDTFLGHISDGVMSGEGTYIFANGAVLKGEFKNNRIVSGEYSYTASDAQNSDVTYLQFEISDSDDIELTFTTADGLRYEGDASGLTGSGSAKIIYPSGNEYEGNVYAGKRNGKGTFTWKDESGNTTAHYTGVFEDDSMTGTGKYYYENAEYPYLSGEFVDGVPQGSCTYYKESGNTFSTTWVNGKCTNVTET